MGALELGLRTVFFSLPNVEISVKGASHGVDGALWRERTTTKALGGGRSNALKGRASLSDKIVTRS